MSRATNAVARKRRKKKVLDAGQGLLRAQALELPASRTSRSCARATTPTATGGARKRDIRRLWIMRINAAARREGMSYSELIHGLDEAGVEVNRKMLADIAVRDPEAFRRFAEQAREAAAA